MSSRAPYIVIEGADGTGKSTQAIILTDHIEGLRYEPLRTFNDETGKLEPVQEPGGTETANKLRLRLKDKSIPRTPWEEVELMTEARISIWNELIKPALHSGRPVVASRSWISTYVYQGVAQGIPLEKIAAYTREKMGAEYMTPDLVVVLSLEDETDRLDRLHSALRSRHKDEDMFESKPMEFQLRLQHGYIHYASEYKIKLTDASNTPESVRDDIWNQAKHLFE